MNKIIALNTSSEKGTLKKTVDNVNIDMNGIVGDAHAGTKNRQISLLSYESINNFTKRTKTGINNGDFAENIIVSGIDFSTISLGDIFKINRVELKVTQIGKECHGHECRIYQEVGDCIMPKEGLFTTVLNPGKIKVNDQVEYLPIKV